MISRPNSVGFDDFPTDHLGNVEEVTAGITDATSFAAGGSPKVNIDWKSDVDPAAETVDHYRAQVLSYIRAMGIANGLIGFVTSGNILPVRLLAVSRPALSIERDAVRS